MTMALEGGEWSAARPGHTLPPGKTRYPLYRRLGGPHGRSGRAENLAPQGFDPRIVQPVVSRYTDWATGPTIKYYYVEQIIDNVPGKVWFVYGGSEKYVWYFSPRFWREKTALDTNKQRRNRASGSSLKKQQGRRGANWIQLIHELNQSLVLVKTVAQILAIFIWGNVFINWDTVSFSRTVLREVTCN